MMCVRDLKDAMPATVSRQCRSVPSTSRRGLRAAPPAVSRFIAFALVATLTACAAGTQVREADSGSVEMEGYRHVDDLYVVDCLLPGQVRQMGRMTYLSPRIPIKTTAFDCRVRGGEYVAYDRADYRSALRVWQDRAESGDAEAQVMVGEIYEKGLGTAPDYTKAAQWYRRAADQGSQRGMTNLAYLYEQGLGVEQDQVAAINLYRKAAGDPGDDLMFASAAREKNERMRAELEQELAEARGQKRALARQIEDLQGRLGQQQSQRQEDRETIAALEKLLADTNSRLTEKSERLDRLASMDVPGEDEDSAARDRPPSREATAGADDDEAVKEALARREEELDRREEALQRKEAQFQEEIQSRRAALAQEEEQARQEIQARREALAREEAQIQETMGSRREALARQESLASEELEERQAALDREEAQARQELLAREEALEREAAQLQAEAQERREALAREEARAREEAQARREALARQEAQVREEAEAWEQELARREAVLDRREEALAEREEALAQEEVASREEPATEPEAPPAAEMRERMEFGRSFALIIGLQDYRYWDKLQLARRDANRIANLLADKYGFETKVLHDASAMEILGAFNELRARSDKFDNVLVYFAGRGQLRRPVEDALVGYWLPIDAQREMSTLWLPNSQINEQIAMLDARSVLVIADSCFAGSMSTDPASLLMGGSAELDQRRIELGLERRARFTLSSGGLHPVPDPRQGEHSIFAGAMIDVLSANQGVLNEQQLIQRLTGRVTERADEMGVDQRPELKPIRSAGHIPGGSFFLVPRPEQAASVAPNTSSGERIPERLEEGHGP